MHIEIIKTTYIFAGTIVYQLWIANKKQNDKVFNQIYLCNSEALNSICFRVYFEIEIDRLGI